MPIITPSAQIVKTTRRRSRTLRRAARSCFLLSGPSRLIISTPLPAEILGKRACFSAFDLLLFVLAILNASTFLSIEKGAPDFKKEAGSQSVYPQQVGKINNNINPPFCIIATQITVTMVAICVFMIAKQS